MTPTSYPFPLIPQGCQRYADLLLHTICQRKNLLPAYLKTFHSALQSQFVVDVHAHYPSQRRDKENRVYDDDVTRTRISVYHQSELFLDIEIEQATQAEQPRVTYRVAGHPALRTAQDVERFVMLNMDNMTTV